MSKPELSIILPCLNEENSISKCINNIKNVIFDAEIIVVNNNSTDKSKQIALNKKVMVIDENKRGYGNAYRTGFKKASQKNIIMVDCDCSYDVKDIPKFLEKLKNYDMVIGNRFANPDKNAMNSLNKFGNSILRLFLKLKGINHKEVCTGFIGIKKNKIPKNLKSEGMEFSSEFLIKTKNLNKVEIPIKFHKRIGKSKLKRFRDGFKHIKIILLTK